MSRPKVTLETYSPEFIKEVSDSAKELLRARDRYIRAWARWNSNCLGCSMGPRDEAYVIEDLLTEAMNEVDVARKAAAEGGEI